MNPFFNQDLFDFISQYSSSDSREIALKFHDKPLNFPLSFALDQIEARKKALKKNGRLLTSPFTLFPCLEAAEQSSCDALSKFHAALLEKGDKVLDMTAGLGIDSIFMSDVAGNVLACEKDDFKSEVLKWNIKKLKINNIEIENVDSISYLKNINKKFDVVFLDPARRDSNKKRLFNFHDCFPDPIPLLPLLKNKSKRVLIKLSPMLDIDMILKEFKDLYSLRVISVEGECKEILIELRFENNKSSITNDILFDAIDLYSDGRFISHFTYFLKYQDNDCKYHQENNASNGNRDCSYKEILSLLRRGNFLYQPNASMMKLAPWHFLTRKFPMLVKLDASTHIFVSPHFYKDFPGRILEFDRVIEKKDRKALKGNPVNVVSRNYPVSAPQIRKELGLKEGNDIFLYAVKVFGKPLMVLSRLLKSEPGA